MAIGHPTQLKQPTRTISSFINIKVTIKPRNLVLTPPWLCCVIEIGHLCEIFWLLKYSRAMHACDFFYASLLFCILIINCVLTKSFIVIIPFHIVLRIWLLKHSRKLFNKMLHSNSAWKYDLLQWWGTIFSYNHRHLNTSLNVCSLASHM